jgi:3-phenylpropionate/trans-cinnamate dioxygenase ferredoxin reductase subunit
MREVEVLIIGGGVAGTTAAETYRSGGGAGEVLVVSDEAHLLYSRVLLPHAVKGKISPDKVFLKKKEFYPERSIGTLFGRSVARVDYGRRAVTLDDGEEIAYRKLVVAPGARPRAWDVPGAVARPPLRLQTYEDAATVAEAVAPGAKLAIVGAGFIGLEFAAIALAKGAEATVLNRGPRFWTSMLGEEISAAVQSALEAAGVRVRNHAKVAERSASGIRLSDGEDVACDLAAVGIGVEVPMAPFGDLAGEHGLACDAALKAKHEGVWVAGDAAEFEDLKLGGLRHAVGNWTNAMAQGRHVGKALLGEEAPYLQLTQYTTDVIPGARLIFLGECRNLKGASSETRVLEAGAKIVEYRRLGDRVVGAILLNAPEARAEALARLG